MFQGWRVRLQTSLGRFDSFGMCHRRLPELVKGLVANQRRGNTYTGSSPVSSAILEESQMWIITPKAEQNDVFINTSAGPGSMTCDRAGPVTIEDCKSCWGTGGCRYGKTEEEWYLLVKSMDRRNQ